MEVSVFCMQVTLWSIFFFYTPYVKVVCSSSMTTCDCTYLGVECFVCVCVCVCVCV